MDTGELRAQNLLNTRQPANENMRVLAVVLLFNFVTQIVKV